MNWMDFLAALESILPDLIEIVEERRAAKEQGKLPPPRVETFPLDRVADAHRAIESGKTMGKLVLLPG